MHAGESGKRTSFDHFLQHFVRFHRKIENSEKLYLHNIQIIDFIGKTSSSFHASPIRSTLSPAHSHQSFRRPSGTEVIRLQSVVHLSGIYRGCIGDVSEKAER